MVGKPGGRPGGIIAAATVVVDHRGPLEYELLTRTAYTLDDLGGGLSWPALFSFIEYLPPGALSEDPGVRAWYSGAYTADLLADIIDILLHRFSKNGQAKPYPRPTDKYTDENKERHHVGAGAIPVRDFEAWWSREG